MRFIPVPSLQLAFRLQTIETTRWQQEPEKLLLEGTCSKISLFFPYNFFIQDRGEKASFKLAKTAKALPEALQKHLFHTSNL